MIADRSESLRTGEAELPGAAMAGLIRAAAGACSELGIEAVAGVPCNTFHAGPIWRAFENGVKDGLAAPPELVHMIDETVGYLKDRCRKGAAIGVLSTNGTRESGLLAKPLERAGFRVVHPERQESVHELIYNPRWGIKSAAAVSAEARSALLKEIDALKRGGAAHIILGCTELPLAVDKLPSEPDLLIDPMEILARKLVKKAEADKLKN